MTNSTHTSGYLTMAQLYEKLAAKFAAKGDAYQARAFASLYHAAMQEDALWRQRKAA